MSTVHEIAALLPDPAELRIRLRRIRLRTLAFLDATFGDDASFCCYTFDAAWGPGEEAASGENGSGDGFSVLFTPAGVLIRGFDHESDRTAALHPTALPDDALPPDSAAQPHAR